MFLALRKGNIPVMSADGRDEIVCASQASFLAVEFSGDVGTARESVFTANDYARHMHVLRDACMTRARNLIVRPKDKDDLDRAVVCSWSYHVALLYNDSNFQPEFIEKFVGGICRNDPSTIDSLGLSVERLYHLTAFDKAEERPKSRSIAFSCKNWEIPLVSLERN
jgi:hypothetical protein